MEDLTDSFKYMQLKKALFTESVDPDEEDTLNISSWKTGLSVRRSFSCGDLCDEDFYPSEVEKELILSDPSKEAQAGNVLQNVTSCSSWAINSQHHPSERFTRTVNRQCRELFVDFSECSGFSASTPKLNRQFLFPTTPVIPKTKDTILKSSVEAHHEVGSARRDSCLFPMLLHGTTTANEFNVPKIAGRAKKQNTQTLEAGVSNDPPRASSSSKGNSSFRSFDVRCCVDATVKTSVKNNVKNLNGEGELWTVQPPVLEMDSNGKGRLLLVNKSSSRNLKFKIVFDGKLITVCPQSGNLKSKSQIGLRVIVSRCMNVNANEVVEDTISITCGKIEKRVPVKIRKVEKISKKKDRSFRCF